MSNILPLLIGGVALVYFMNSKRSVAENQSYVNVEKIPPIVNCIDLGNNLLAFPRIQLSEKEINSIQPMIIVLHGRNGNENQLANVIPKDLKARVFFFRANTKNNLFFIPRLKDKEEIVAPALEKSAGDVLEGIDLLLGIYPTNKLIIVGFSQGGSIAEFIGSIGKADSIISWAGSLPSLLYPKQKYNTNILLYHGSKDLIVPYKLDLAASKAFKEKGFNVVFRETKNGHIIPPKSIINEFFDIAIT